MKIWCTVFRANGTYKSIPIKAGEDSFELDGKHYEIEGYYIGRAFGFIPVLRACYFENYPKPVFFNTGEAMAKGKFKIDGRAILNITNKKVIGVFNEDELSKVEKILVIAMIVIGALAGVSMVFSYMIYDMLSKVI